MVSKKMKTITLYNKRNWKSLLTLLTLIVLIPATMNAADTWEYNKTSFSGGKGTKENPYLISTAQDLASLTYQTSYFITSYKNFKDVYFKQTADIVLNDDVLKSVSIDAYGRAVFNETSLNKLKDWFPIGIYGRSTLGYESCYWFMGHYDGDGHSISGIYCYRGDHDNTYDSGNGYDNYLGLFGAVQNGSIKNLTLKDCLIRVRDDNAKSNEWRYIGILVGKAENTVISNCHVENAVICSENLAKPTEVSVGGIVGYCNITDYTGDYELKDCTFNGKINIWNATTSCSPSLGGICGTINASDNYLNSHSNPKISGCQARGVIAYNYGNNTNPAEYIVYAGGILGKFNRPSNNADQYASIYRCTNFINTDVISTNSNVYAGGLSGYLASCEQSANFGNLTVNKTGGTVNNVYAGGIGSFTKIDNCVNYGTLTLGFGSSEYPTMVTGNAYLGTLAVCGLGTAASSDNPCNIVNSANCSSIVSTGVSGNCYTDGVCVFGNTNTSGSNSNVYNCSSTQTSYTKSITWEAKDDYQKYANLTILNDNAKANGAKENIWGQLDSPQSIFHKYLMPLAPCSVPAVKLDENDDNLVSLIADNAFNADLQNKVSVTWVRNLKVGYWNTICLPFAMTAEQLKASFGNEVKVEHFKDATIDASGKVTINFASVTEIEAGKPYLIKPSQVSTEQDTYVLGTYELIPKLLFSESTLTNGSIVSMIGSYGKFTLKGDGGTDQYFLQGDKFYHIVVSNPISAKGFRCYFTIQHPTSTPLLTLAKIQHADGSPTNIQLVEAGTAADGTKIYDLQGIEHTKLEKGIYVAGGKKFIVK